MSAKGWRRARQGTQVASTALFFLLALLTYRGAQFVLPLDLFLRLDPLVGFSAMLAGRVVITTMLLALVMLALGLVTGRGWCGWLCPLGALLDWISPRTPRKRELHPQWRSVKYVLLVVILVAALLGNLTFLIFDPITLLNRTFATAVMPALNVVITQLETTLYRFEPLQPALEAFENTLRGSVLPAQQTYYELGALFALLLATVFALNWVAPRFWCRYLCPLGAVYAVQAPHALLRPRAIADCNHCAACLRTCPTGAITVTKSGFQLEPAECVMCMDCAAACPLGGIYFRPARTVRTLAPVPTPASSATEPINPSGATHLADSTKLAASKTLTRREALGGLGLAVAAVALFRTAPSAQRIHPQSILPPGAQRSDFLSLCIRCGECVRVCPTGGLQASWTEAGAEGLWTPTLVPRLGYCDYGCTACGQVCPTGAISLLDLAQKRETIIGTAYIDTNRCIPYASGEPCIVCEEMCPLSPKAISLEPVEVVKPGGTVQVQRPHVDHARCIGCGICEYQCPVTGAAAIRVYAATPMLTRS